MPFDFFTGMDTGTATYVLFEAERVAAIGAAHHFWLGEGEVVYGWYADRGIQVQLMQQGLVAFIDVGIDGGFLFRLTDGGLTEEEEARVLQVEKHIWFEVKRPNVIFGAAEALPVHSDDPEEFVEEFGTSFTLNPGRYHVTIYRLIGWHEGDRDLEEEDVAEEILHPDGLRLPAYIVQFQPFAEGDIPPIIKRVPVLSPLA